MIESIVVLAVSAAAQALPVGQLPSYQEPAKAWNDIASAADSLCKPRLEQATTDKKPRLDRKPERGDEAKAIRAVDTSIGGCPVIVRKDGSVEVAPSARQVLPSDENK